MDQNGIWGQIRVDKTKFGQIITWPTFNFGQLFIWIGASNDQLLLPMGYMSDSEQCSNRLELDLIFTFGQLFMWIGANNDQTWLSMGYASDSEQCSNRLELDLISLLVNFSCELGQTMTRYDLLSVTWVILSNVQIYLNLT